MFLGAFLYILIRKNREVFDRKSREFSSRLRTRYRLTAVRVPRDTHNPLSFSLVTRKDSLIIIMCKTSIVITIRNVIFSSIFHFYRFSNISYISWWILPSNQKRINKSSRDPNVLTWIINPIDRNPTYNFVNTFRTTTLVSQCNRNYTVQEQLENLYIPTDFKSNWNHNLR